MGPEAVTGARSVARAVRGARRAHLAVFPALAATSCSLVFGYPAGDEHERAATCANGRDDDFDGDVDCDDGDCRDEEPCRGSPEADPTACQNRVDDDRDGRVDCDDDDCRGHCPETTPTSCGNSVDDDGDGAVDREDLGCWQALGDVPAVRACASIPPLDVAEPFPLSSGVDALGQTFTARGAAWYPTWASEGRSDARLEVVEGTVALVSHFRIAPEPLLQVRATLAVPDGASARVLLVPAAAAEFTTFELTDAMVGIEIASAEGAAALTAVTPGVLRTAATPAGPWEVELAVTEDAVTASLTPALGDVAAVELPRPLGLGASAVLVELRRPPEAAESPSVDDSVRAAGRSVRGACGPALHRGRDGVRVGAAPRARGPGARARRGGGRGGRRLRRLHRRDDRAGRARAAGGALGGRRAHVHPVRNARRARRRRDHERRRAGARPGPLARRGGGEPRRSERAERAPVLHQRGLRRVGPRQRGRRSGRGQPEPGRARRRDAGALLPSRGGPPGTRARPRGGPDRRGDPDPALGQLGAELELALPLTLTRVGGELALVHPAPEGTERAGLALATWDLEREDTPRRVELPLRAPDRDAGERTLRAGALLAAGERLALVYSATGRPLPFSWPVSSGEGTFLWSAVVSTGPPPATTILPPFACGDGRCEPGAESCASCADDCCSVLASVPAPEPWGSHYSPALARAIVVADSPLRWPLPSGLVGDHALDLGVELRASDDPASGRLTIHLHDGEDRGPRLVAAYRPTCGTGVYATTFDLDGDALERVVTAPCDSTDHRLLFGPVARVRIERRGGDYRLALADAAGCATPGGELAVPIPAAELDVAPTELEIVSRDPELELLIDGVRIR